MQVILLALFVGTFVAGFLASARMVKTVPMQLFLGFLLGMALCTMLAVTMLGAAFAGCIFMAAKGGVH